MALTATIYNLRIDLADIDRGIYETVEICVPRHRTSKSGNKWATAGFEAIDGKLLCRKEDSNLHALAGTRT